MIKLRNLIKKFSYAFIANVVSTLVTVVSTLVIPKYLGDDIAGYGYFQIYFFYITYVGFFHFGICDGLLLRDGGKQYSELNKKMYSTQFWILCITEFIIATSIILIAKVFNVNSEYYYITVMVSCNAFLLCTRQFLLYIFQATAKIKEYSIVMVVGRFFYLTSIICVFFVEFHNYRFFVYGDVIAKTISLLVGCWLARDIVFCYPGHFILALKEFKANINVGIKLLLANIAGYLIVGIVRLGIQQHWDVETYGKISFTLSVSNLLQALIGAAALVLYPTLKRKQTNELSHLYTRMRDALMIPLLGALVLYYPVERILSLWLPQYAESLRFMAILFPLCIFSAKQNMLVQTYMQVFRLEKEIMQSNIYGVILAVLTTVISVYLCGSLSMAMFSIVINQIFRCVYAEIRLQKEIKISIKKDLILEILLAVSFIFASWVIGGTKGVVLYLVFYIAYIIYKRKDVCNLLVYLRKLKR